MITWPKVDPGEMVHRVTILKQALVTDVSGQTEQWKPFTFAWAKIEVVSGTDVLKAGVDVAQLHIVVTLQWQAGVLPTMRVQTESGSVYIVQSVENPAERNVLLVLNCLALQLNQ